MTNWLIPVYTPNAPPEVPVFTPDSPVPMTPGCQTRVDMILTSQRHYRGVPDIEKYIFIGEQLGCGYYLIGGGNLIGNQYL